ncbi:hypothetical protein V1517DRAFT_363231 [Lipomyces orientalis]|uniref:Uncharacterized protein n=1 Tax=Lipomyces orientalis TaxID=1233043 RepID=A0ACC3TJV8_9ASCO
MEGFTRPRRQPEGDEPVENISLTRGLQSPIESSFELGPEDSISQIVDPSLSRNLTDEAQEISPVLTHDRISSQRPLITLNQQWKPKRSKMLSNDQLITCKHCRNWSFKDSARSTSTTNMSYHLQRAHSLGISNDTKNQSRIMTITLREESYSLGRAYKTAIYCH